MNKMNEHGQQQPPPAGFAPPPPYSEVQQGAPHPGYAMPLPPTAQYVPPQQAPGPQQQTVIIVQNTSFGPYPQSMTCPHCHVDMVTSIDTGPTMMTHMAFLLCCIFICWPCAPFVYCSDCCLAKKHYCSNCNRYLGQCDASG